MPNIPSAQNNPNVGQVKQVTDQTEGNESKVSGLSFSAIRNKLPNPLRRIWKSRNKKREELNRPGTVFIHHSLSIGQRTANLCRRLTFQKALYSTNTQVCINHPLDKMDIAKSVFDSNVEDAVNKKQKEAAQVEYLNTSGPSFTEHNKNINKYDITLAFPNKTRKEPNPQIGDGASSIGTIDTTKLDDQGNKEEYNWSTSDSATSQRTIDTERTNTGENNRFSAISL